jgi:outer membrane protein insertion porin family
LFRKGFTRGLAVALTASCLCMGRLWSSPQSGGDASQTQEPAVPAPSVLPEKPTACFGNPVEKIEFAGVPEPDQQTLRGMIAAHEGEALDRRLLQESLRTLFATGRFADLRAECDRTTDGRVLLSFSSTPNFFVGRVSVEGAPAHPTESQIVNASKLELGELFNAEKMDRALANIRRLMEDSEFYRAAVTHSELQNPTNHQVEITFHVQTGEPARIGNITLKGKGIYSLGQIEDIAHLHPGNIISAQKAADALERIRKKYQKRNYWLAQVRIAEKKYVPASNTVDYTFEIETGLSVEIAVEGFRLSRKTLRRNVPVYEENALDDDLLNEGQRNLLSYVESRGYFDATVDLKRESDLSKNMLRVIYQIDPGERHKVVKVEITGNQYLQDQNLRPLMQVQESSLLLSRGRFSQALLKDDIRTMENIYRAQGFARVKITGQVEDDYKGAHNQLAVLIGVSEGPQTLVGSFQIVGNTTPIDDPFPALSTSMGQPFSDANIAQDRDILLNYYFNNGFPDASFEASAKPADNRMDVTFTIHEGQRIYVDRVLLAGREFTKPYVIDHELHVKPDDDLSQVDLLNTQQSLYDLGIFSQVETAVQNPEGVQTRKNVLVQVQEARRYTFNYGLGFEFQTGQRSAGVSPLASFDLTRLNFLGRAHTITFQSRGGRLQQRGLISYEAPRFRNNPDWKLTFSGFFDHTLDVATFTSQRLEGSAQIEQIVSRKADQSPATVMNYRFNYRLVKATKVQIRQDQVPLLSQPVRVGEPGFSYLRNRRDNELEITRGSYITADAGVAARYFGSEADFSRLLVQYSTYHQFGKQQKSTKQLVFARSTRVGLENSFANTVVIQPGQPTPSNRTLIPLPERLFMGGGNSHRGFGLNQAGPRDPITGFPTGGAALFLNNLELRFPPPTLPYVQDNMSFAIFHDMGNVFTDGSHMLNSLLRWRQNKQLCTQSSIAEAPAPQPAMLCNYNYVSNAIGLGIRYKTPVGPVRFDLGYNLNPTIYPNFVSGPNSTPAIPTYVFTGTKQASPFNVYFSIGQTF